MGNERYIEPAKNRDDKRIVYAKQMKRLEQAFKHEFYLEAVMIDYAIMEDRLRAWLYHIGALNLREDSTCKAKPTKNYLRSIVAHYKKMEIEKTKLTIQDISAKADVIRATLLWASTVEVLSENDKYLLMLKERYESAIDIGVALELLDNINTWCKKRNEVVHGLMNKNIFDYEEKIKGIAEEGYLLARSIDNCEKQLKSGCKIRKQLKMSAEKQNTKNQQ